MAVKQNAADFSLKFPVAARVVNESFYVDDGLTGADSVDEAIALQSCRVRAHSRRTQGHTIILHTA